MGTDVASFVWKEFFWKLQNVNMSSMADVRTAIHKNVAGEILLSKRKTPTYIQLLYNLLYLVRIVSPEIHMLEISNFKFILESFTEWPNVQKLRKNRWI